MSAAVRRPPLSFDDDKNPSPRRQHRPASHEGGCKQRIDVSTITRQSELGSIDMCKSQEFGPLIAAVTSVGTATQEHMAQHAMFVHLLTSRHRKQRIEFVSSIIAEPITAAKTGNAVRPLHVSRELGSLHQRGRLCSDPLPLALNEKVCCSRGFC